MPDQPDTRLLARPEVRLALAALALVLGAAMALLSQLSSNVRPSPRTADAVSRELTPPPPPAPRSGGPAVSPPTYVVVMGTDREDGKALVRTLLLARLDPASAAVSVLWVPSATKVAGEPGEASVSDSYASAGTAGVIRAVKRLTGLPVHHYVSFRTEGLADAVDTMGGVRVEPALLGGDAARMADSDGTAESPPADGDETLRLDGEAVLEYARGGADPRSGALVAAAALTQARERLLSPQGLSLLLSASRSVETDMGGGEMLRLGTAMREAADSEVPQSRLPASGQDGGKRLSAGDRKLLETVRHFSGTEATAPVGR
ncbi:MAG: LCP family protein [Coriobacteriia bacterium]|nr:LCP family protein [Coriobacteriia bacterium]